MAAGSIFAIQGGVHHDVRDEDDLLDLPRDRLPSLHPQERGDSPCKYIEKTSNRHYLSFWDNKSGSGLLWT
jgi:hypothetical protein